MTWHSCFAAIVLAACATTAPTGAQQVAPNSDQAFALVGTWKCESVACSLGTMTFTRDAPGSISMKNVFRTTDGLSGEFDETYRFDSGSSTWKWESHLRSASNFNESGTAGPWTTDKWTFEGTQDSGQASEPIHMVYTKQSNSAFTREFETSVNGTWLPQNASSCTRGSNLAASMSIGDLKKKMAAAAKTVHTQIASGPVVMEMYIADGYLYHRVGSSAWQKQPMPSAAALPADSIKTLVEGTRIMVGADVSEGGVTYGSYQVSIATASIPGAPAAGPRELSCTYDKSTFLTHECKNSFITETFLDYNDPNNAVTLPAELSTVTVTPTK
jgi:hypothetical protein